MVSDKGGTHSPISTHMGHVLMMLANSYNTLPLTAAEMTQNAIDASATRVFIAIDIDGREVFVLDNGNGVDKTMFEEALASVAETQKNPTQIGKFGIGMISPLNKCSKFYFVSQSIIGTHPVRWTFEAKQIDRQKENPRIPCDNLPSMPILPRRFADYAVEIADGKWHTMVHMVGLTTDRTVTRIDLDFFEEQIRTKLGYHMHRRGVEMRVVLIENGTITVRDIKPQTFTGEPLGVVAYESDDVGLVEIELYRARKVNGKRKGGVSVSEMDVIYPVAWRDFLNQARGGGWAKLSEAFDALGSGYFEGVIRAKGIRLTPERTKFEYNDALAALYMVIDQWYADEGKKHFETEQDELRDERYHQISLNVMNSIRDMLRLPEFENLSLGINAHVSFGSIGEGHGQKKAANIPGRTGVRLGQGGAGKPRVPGSGSRTNGRSSDGPSRDGDMPFGVVGKGRKRTEVKDDSLGLWIEVTDFEFSTRLWEFDRTRGLLSFNSSNVLWADLDGEYAKRRTVKNDRMLEHLQKWIILKVLVLLTLPAEEFDSARELVDRETKAYIYAFIKP